MSFVEKYLKYKNKYLTLKNQLGGCPHQRGLPKKDCPICTLETQSVSNLGEKELSSFSRTPRFNIQVRNLAGEILVADVPTTATVLKLKQRISALHGIDVELQKLFLEGPNHVPIVLVNSNTLASYGIDNNTIVHIFISSPPAYVRTIANGMIATDWRGMHTQIRVTTNGELIISDQRSITVYNPADGSSRIITGTGDNNFMKPYDICVSNDELFITDSNMNRNTRVLVFQISNGTYLRKIDLPRQVIYDGEIFRIYISNTNELYITDNTAKCVYVYSTNGTLLRTISNMNVEWYYHLCLVPSTDELIVCGDIYMYPSHIFRASDGTYLRSINNPNIASGMSLLQPTFISVDDKIYKSNPDEGTVSVLNATDYTLVQTINTGGAPFAMCTSPAGELLIANTTKNCVDVYTL